MPSNALEIGPVEYIVVEFPGMNSRAKLHPAPAAPATPIAGAMTDKEVSQLKQLADLRNQGILPVGDFSAQKAKLLGE